MDAETPRLTDDEKAFMRAALDGDAERIRRLLSAGVNVNSRNAETYPLGMEWNTTALMLRGCERAFGHRTSFARSRRGRIRGQRSP